VKGIVHVTSVPPYWRSDVLPHGASIPVSFFDDDEPPTRAARTPRPSRGSSSSRSGSGSSRPAARRSSAGRSGGPGDSQQLLVRRLVALGAVAVVLVIIIFGFKSCRDSAHKNSLRDYNQNVATIVRDSDEQVGKPLFDLLQSKTEQSPVSQETQINQYRVVAEDQASRARSLSVPGDMAAAQRDLLMTLDFRAEALGAIADTIRTALGSENAASRDATSQIAGQMQKLLASDVIYSQRTAPLIKETLDDNGITGQTIAASKFLPNLGWLDPDTVAARIGGTGTAGTKTPTTPGPHGHGLTSVAIGSTTLQPQPAVNRVAAGSSTAFNVSFQNQGASDETNVKLTVRITAEGQKAIVVTKTVPQTKAGATSQADVPLGQSPPIGTPVTVKVTIGKVPGEQTLSNNTQTYTVLFTR
jgi:hypothetical protein